MSDLAYPEYLWLVVVGSFAAFLYGFGTGSNDVANAFGTSVGAKTITLRQAVLIAAIFEFIGAMVLGRVSTSTIAGGIADITAFQREPEIYAYGMVCALTVAGVWQVLSSYWEYNTSSTHSIIGSIIGFSLAYAGADAVLWQVEDKNSFPPYKGVVPIIVSWFFSPLFTGIAALLLLLCLRTLVLRRKRAYMLAFWVLPPAVLLTVFICVYFVFTKGAKKTLSSGAEDWTDAKAAWIAACVGAGMAVLTAAVAIPILHWYSQKQFKKQEELEAARAKEAGDVEGQAVAEAGERPSPSLAARPPAPSALSRATAQVALTMSHGSPTEVDGAGASTSQGSARPVVEAKEEEAGPAEGVEGVDADGAAASRRATMWQKTMSRGKEWFDKIDGTNVDVHAVIDEDPIVAAIHANAEVFDPKAESVFRYLQVFSAICVTFSHGAGEVGYMSGPLGTIWEIVQTGKLSKNVEADVWCVVIGAVALVIGLATYGYNVTRAVGVKMSKLSPSRGFSAELATAFVIMIAAQYGLPTSSSQCITGGIIGCGLLEGTAGVNWKFFAVQFISWILTLFVTGLGTAALFSMGAYAPSVNCGRDVIVYENYLAASHNTILKDINATLEALRPASKGGPGGTSLVRGITNEKQITDLQKQLKWAVDNVSFVTSTKGQTASPYDLTDYHARAMKLLQANSVNTIGQSVFYPNQKVCTTKNVTLLNGTDTAAMQTATCNAPKMVPSGYPTVGVPGGWPVRR